MEQTRMHTHTKILLKSVQIILRYSVQEENCSNFKKGTPCLKICVIMWISPRHVDRRSTVNCHGQSRWASIFVYNTMCVMLSVARVPLREVSSDLKRLSISGRLIFLVILQYDRLGAQWHEMDTKLTFSHRLCRCFCSSNRLYSSVRWFWDINK